MTSEEKAATAGSGGEKLLAKVRAKENTYSALVKTNSETFRLSNDGRFPVKVSLAFEDQPQVRSASALSLRHKPTSFGGEGIPDNLLLFRAKGRHFSG